jgi:hypothetical protein
MKGCYQVDGDGKGGGIALFWQEGIDVKLLSYSQRHIDVHAQGGPYSTRWRGTFIYGEPKPADRHQMWTLLRDLKPRSSDPWLLLGDFNEAMWQSEHFSRARRSERLMMEFREVLSHCDVHDLGFVGTPWTFDNKQAGERNVKVRLDRAVANPAWSSLFPEVRVHHLMSSRSDHCPLLVTVTLQQDQRRSQARRYEIMWEREPSLAFAVEDAWSRRVTTQNLGDISASFRNVMASLYDWKKKYFGSLPQRMEKCRKKLNELSLLSDEASVAERKRLLAEMDEQLYREELMWLQRSRIAWLRDGDRNTKYFHRKASWRHKKNRISKLQREDGTWATEPDEMEGMATSFFQNLYSHEEGLQPNIILDRLSSRVDNGMNERLCAPFSEQEISDALFQIGPSRPRVQTAFPHGFFSGTGGLLRKMLLGQCNVSLRMVPCRSK